ncbi:hypothetical protein BBI01_07245 [Chryseobacterium artocarpi]|uniref:Tyr recombinase domain-containing protein n=2 Tax=Chryseobacterium artocarpi TaxID=1414727 RepID=A0A1B8ZLX2_9FLAO|nr:hypothetical protein BBI01_07245 [Chryseobacterium artocarpi]
MSKKLGQITNGKRIRRISSILGKELELLISETKKVSPPTNAMFVTSYNNHVRCPCHIINRILLESFSFVNLGSIELRHHLAQSFADDGAPIEIIAEILGHNTLIASKAYIKATPKIVEIKTKALGKFEPYHKIINMLLTGEIINKPQSIEKNWVQGIVGMEYIGEIGKCNLQQICPKNPIYSCYTCKKFHPFKNGDHHKVLEALEKHVQLFIDIGLKRNDIKNNRTIIQLRETITAVKTVIQIISQNEQANK